MASHLPLTHTFFSEMRLSQGQLILQHEGIKLKCTGAIIVCGNARNEGVAAVVESRCDIRPEPEARCNCPTSTSLVLHSNTYQSSVTPPHAPVWAYNLPGMISPCKDQQFGRDRPSLNTRGVMKPSQIIVKKPFGTLPSSYKSGIVKLT